MQPEISQANLQEPITSLLATNTHDQNFEVFIHKFRLKSLPYEDERNQFKEEEINLIGLRGRNSVNEDIRGKVDEKGNTFLNYVIDQDDSRFPRHTDISGTSISSKPHYIEKILNGMYKNVSRGGNIPFRLNTKNILERIRNAIGAQNEDGDTALHKAIKRGDFDIVELLLKSNEELPNGESLIADISLANKNSETPFEMLKNIIEQNKTVFLKQCVRKGHHSILKTLFNDRSCVSQEDINYLLTFALDTTNHPSDSDKTNMVELLLKNEAHNDNNIIKLHTDISSAIENGAMNLAKILVGDGGNINFSNALKFSAKNGRSEMFGFLADKKFGYERAIDIGMVPELLKDVFEFSGRLGPRQCFYNDKHIQSKSYYDSKEGEMGNIVNRILQQQKKEDLQRIFPSDTYLRGLLRSAVKNTPIIAKLIATILDDKYKCTFPSNQTNSQQGPLTLPNPANTQGASFNFKAMDILKMVVEETRKRTPEGFFTDNDDVSSVKRRTGKRKDLSLEHNQPLSDKPRPVTREDLGIGQAGFYPPFPYIDPMHFQYLQIQQLQQQIYLQQMQFQQTQFPQYSQQPQGVLPTQITSGNNNNFPTPPTRREIVVAIPSTINQSAGTNAQGGASLEQSANMDIVNLLNPTPENSRVAIIYNNTSLSLQITTLQKACMNENLERVNEAILSGANVNEFNDPTNRITALHIAANNGNIKIVEALLNNGAKADLSDKNGHTALHIANLQGFMNVSRLLIKAESEINLAKDKPAPASEINPRHGDQELATHVRQEDRNNGKGPA